MKALCLFFALLIVGFTGCTDAPSLHNRHLYAVDSISLLPENERESSKIFIQKVEEISLMADAIKAIDSLQNGVCDTCVTGYQSAIIENRKVAEALSTQTAILHKKVEIVEKQIRSVDAIVANNDVQLSHLRSINLMAIRKKNKQKNEYYSLAKGR